MSVSAVAASPEPTPEPKPWPRRLAPTELADILWKAAMHQRHWHELDPECSLLFRLTMIGEAWLGGRPRPVSRVRTEILNELQRAPYVEGCCTWRTD